MCRMYQHDIGMHLSLTFVFVMQHCSMMMATSQASHHIQPSASCRIPSYSTKNGAQNLAVAGSLSDIANIVVSHQ